MQKITYKSMVSIEEEGSENTVTAGELCFIVDMSIHEI